MVNCMDTAYEHIIQRAERGDGTHVRPSLLGSCIVPGKYTSAQQVTLPLRQVDSEQVNILLANASATI